MTLLALNPLVSPDPGLFIWSTVAFLILFFLLSKYAWKPIVAALDERERSIEDALSKAEMAKVPIFGYVYKKAGILVDRGSEEGRMKSLGDMKKMLAQNISIVIAPEGTFNMTHRPLKEFYNGAFKIAVEMQVPVQPVLFLDTYDRLNYNSIFSMTPGRSRAVFLPEMQPGDDPDLLKEKTYGSMEKALIRYNASWIRE